MKKENITREKTLAFAIRIVNLFKHLTDDKKEYVMSRQVLKSGTSIGANAREAENAESPADFIHKLSISQKEAGETLYWLEILYATKYISRREFNSLYNDGNQIYAMLTSSIIPNKQKHKIKYNLL